LVEILALVEVCTLLVLLLYYAVVSTAAQEGRVELDFVAEYVWHEKVLALKLDAVWHMFAVGNLLWLKSLHSSVITDKTPASQHTDSDAAAAAAGDSANDVVVLVNGALVNINSVLQNLSKSEEERSQMENEWKNVEQECGVYHLFACSQFTTTFLVCSY